jgi:protein tyrosine/serine phosphatase
MKSHWLTLLAALTLPISNSRADALSDASSDIPRFQEVSPGFYRGGHPDRAGLEDLAKLGVKTVIDLENDDSDVPREMDDGKALGLNMISQPMSMFFAPSNSQVDSILSQLNDPSLRPIFLHCTFGEDRTGVIVGLYRVEMEHVAPATAYSEMLDLGFKNHLMVFMDRFFKKRVGMSSREHERD